MGSLNNTPGPSSPTKRFNRNVISGRASRRVLNHRYANRPKFGPITTFNSIDHPNHPLYMTPKTKGL